jgi:hypothetical protein
MDLLTTALVAAGVGNLSQSALTGGPLRWITVLLALCAITAASLWARWVKSGYGIEVALADAVLSWITAVDGPVTLVALFAGLCAPPAAPEVARQLSRGLGRLTGIEAGGVKLELAGPTPGAEGAALDMGDGALWVPVGAAWERLAPLQEGEVQAGAPPAPKWSRFKEDLAVKLASVQRAIGTAGTDRAQLETEAHKSYSDLYAWLADHESADHVDGWTGEYADHLSHTADALDRLAIDRPRRLNHDLARALIFRRGMLLDAAVRSGASDEAVGEAAKALFASAVRTDRAALKAFARNPRTAAVVALLVQLGRPEDLEAIADIAAPRDEVAGVGSAARAAAAWLRTQKAPEGRSSTAYGVHLWALQELLRARAWSAGPRTAAGDAHAAAHALALLRGLPVDAPHPGPTLRRSAARIAARCGGLPGDDGNGLLALAPELLIDPDGLNDVAVLAARSSTARAAAILARAATLAAPGSPLAAAIAANLKKLGEV